MTQQQANQNMPVAPFTDDTLNDTKPAKADSSIRITKASVQKLFNKPLKWSFIILRLLVIILIPLLSSAADIQLNFYIINIMF